MDHLERLENQSIYIIREAYAKFDKLATLWSMGKDSTVLLWLIKKAFIGHCPISAVHIDTSYKIPAMIKYREKIASKWGLDLVVGQNRKALKAGMCPEKGRLKCCEALKTLPLQELVARQFVGARGHTLSEPHGRRPLSVLLAAPRGLARGAQERGQFFHLVGHLKFRW